MTSYLEPVPDATRELLFRIASRFRLAILMVNSECGLPSLYDFPRGSCSDASLLLAKYLQVNDCGLSHFVIGERRRSPHAWLQLVDYTIDITADQFDDQDAGVIVSKASSWHDVFNGKIHGAADFCLYDRSTVVRLTRAYQAVSAALICQDDALLHGKLICTPASLC